MMIHTRKDIVYIRPALERSCSTCPPSLAVWDILFKDKPGPESFCWDCFNILMSKQMNEDQFQIEEFYQKWKAEKNNEAK